jgi:hypothetical protein
MSIAKGKQRNIPGERHLFPNHDMLGKSVMRSNRFSASRFNSFSKGNWAYIVVIHLHICDTVCLGSRALVAILTKLDHLISRARVMRGKDFSPQGGN